MIMLTIAEEVKKSIYVARHGIHIMSSRDNGVSLVTSVMKRQHLFPCVCGRQVPVVFLRQQVVEQATFWRARCIFCDITTP